MNYPNNPNDWPKWPNLPKWPKFKLNLSRCVNKSNVSDLDLLHKKLTLHIHIHIHIHNHFHFHFLILQIEKKLSNATWFLLVSKISFSGPKDRHCGRPSEGSVWSWPNLQTISGVYSHPEQPNLQVTSLAALIFSPVMSTCYSTTLECGLNNHWNPYYFNCDYCTIR